MMTILEKDLIYSPDKPYDGPYITKVGEADILKIQISGTDDCIINIYGRLSTKMNEEKMSLIKDVDYSIVNMITKQGIYTVPCDGYHEIKIEAITIGNDISCYVVKGESADD